VVVASAILEPLIQNPESFWDMWVYLLSFVPFLFGIIEPSAGSAPVSRNASSTEVAAAAAATAGTGTGEDQAAAAAAASARAANELAAEQAAAAEVIAEARKQINEKVAAAVLSQAPKVIAAANNIIEKSQVCRDTRDSVLTSLNDIFPDLDIEPWLELGSEPYMQRRLGNLQTVRSNQYVAPIHTGGNTWFDPSDKGWNQYASRDQRERLDESLLTTDSVLQYLWQDSSLQGSGMYGPADNNTYVTTAKKWSWVSELDKTFTRSVPDFGIFVDSYAYTYEAEGPSVWSGTSVAAAAWGAAGHATEAGADGVASSGYQYSTMWPHGWLTTLETTMALMGYYVQAADQSIFEGYNLRNGPTYQAPYSLFTAGDIRHLEGDGDPELGWNSIMDANHANLTSWTKGGVLPYNPNESIAGNNTPENFVLRSFSEASAGMCDGPGVWQTNENWTSNLAGMSPMLSQLKPWTLIRTGGPLSQGVFNSQWTHSDENEGKHRVFKKWTPLLRFLDRLSQKLSADAERFRQLHLMFRSFDEDNVTVQQASILAMLTPHASGIAAGRLERATTTTTSIDAGAAIFAKRMIAEIIEGNVYMKLNNLLSAISSFVGGTLAEIRDSHSDIKEAHQQVIIDTCKAIGEVAGAFTDDDSWYNLFDDGDDWADEATRAAVGNPFEELGVTMIGTGATNVMFKEQCFLLSFITDFAASKINNLDRGNEPAPATKRLPYYQSTANVKSLDNNATILMDGGSYGFLNKLTQNPKLTRFYNALNHELSNLQPKIRLWKVIFDEEGKEQEVEIKFESHFSAADLDMFKNSAARGVGAGLKSFNFTYDGSNPFAVKKSIKANLKIFANTMSEILRDRPSHYVDDQGTLQPTTYKYSDLAMKTWNTAEADSEDMEEGVDTPSPCAPAFDLLSENTEKSELNFRLKAEVGFSQPINAMSSMHEDLREALSESFVTLNLTPTVHNFEIDEMGRVIFNLNFLAYIEQFFDQSMFNVFSSAPIALNRIYRQLVMKHYNSSGCSSDQISQQKEDFAGEVKGETEQAIASLIGDMMTEDLIYYINLPYEKITSFLSYGPHRTYNEFAGSNAIAIRSNAQHNEYLKTRVASALSTAFGAESQAGTNKSEKNQIQAALLGNDPREADLSFFYLSDLIDLILVKIETGISETIENINELDNKPQGTQISCEDKMAKRKDLLNAQKNLKRLRIMLGPMELTHPQAHDGHTSIHVNLGDCPISVKYFVEWLTNKMLQKDQVTYNLTKFVNDLINNLIRNFLNNDQCFGYSVKQKTRLNQSAISSYGAHPTYDPVTLPAVAAAEAAIGAANASIETVAAEAAAPGAGVAAQVAGIAGAMAGSLADGGNKANFRARLNDYEMPVLNPSGPSNSARTSMPVSNEYNYFVYFAGRVMPTELMKGEKASDEEKFGIFHYMLGRDRGLVKNIKLTKTQTKGLAEVRFEQSGYDGLQQLRVTYDAQVDMFASVNTFPGTYIYIDPRGFAPEGSGDENFKLTSLGIGGYYMIIRSEHEFAEGKANTVLHTKWVNQVDGEASERDNQMAEASSGTGDARSRNCSISLRADPEEEVELPGFGAMLGF